MPIIKPTSALLCLAAAAATGGIGQSYCRQPGPPTRHLAAPISHKSLQEFAETNWFSLQSVSAHPGLIRPITTTAPTETTDWVTVHAQRVGHREQDWRSDLRGGAVSYEASNSAAASSPYTSYPEWSSPDEERTMSSIKDSLGLCGAGPITCPSPP